MCYVVLDILAMLASVECVTFAFEIIAAAGVVHVPKKNPDEDGDNQQLPEHIRHSVRRSAEGHSSADEDSDFD